MLFCGLLLSACTVHVFSPPGGAPLIESSATIGEGRHSVRGDIQGGGGAWGPQLTSYRLTVARGITPQLDVSVAPSIVSIHAPEPGNPHGGIYSLRMGVKYAPVRFVAFSTGLTPGGSVGGGYIAQDAGITLAGENPYLIPFAGFHGLYSVPLNAKTVRILHTDDEEDYTDGDDDEPPSERGPDVYYLKPLFTAGWQLVAGLKLPLTHDRTTWSGQVIKRRVRPSLACALGFTALYTKVDSDLFVTGGCALDATF